MALITGGRGPRSRGDISASHVGVVEKKEKSDLRRRER